MSENERGVREIVGSDLRPSDVPATSTDWTAIFRSALSDDETRRHFEGLLDAVRVKAQVATN